MSDFSDRPFVAGSLIGLRAFRVDTLGRLLGPSVPRVFKPGENEALCLKVDAVPGTLSFAYNNLFNSVYGGMPPMTLRTFSPPAIKAPAPRSYGTGPCPCGCDMEVEFTDGEHTLAEKAVAPKPTPKPTHVLGGVKCTCGFYAYFDGNNDYKEAGNVAALIEGYGVCTFGGRGFRAAKARLVAIVEPKAKVSPVLRDYLHRNYPDVPFYATKRDALAEHPLTPQPVATPDDEDFWTREATR